VLLAGDAAALLVLFALNRATLGAGDFSVGSGGGFHAVDFGLTRFHSSGFAFR
jgi:hypothetical protein